MRFQTKLKRVLAHNLHQKEYPNIHSIIDLLISTNTTSQTDSIIDFWRVHIPVVAVHLCYCHNPKAQNVSHLHLCMLILLE